MNLRILAIVFLFCFIVYLLYAIPFILMLYFSLPLAISGFYYFKVIDKHIPFVIKLIHLILRFGSFISFGGTDKFDRKYVLRKKFYKKSNSKLTIDYIHVTARDGHKLELTIYTPKNYQKELNIVYYVHGGGWVFQSSLDIYEPFVSEGMIVICVDYRVAPEYKFPTAFNDAYDAFEYIIGKQPGLERVLPICNRKSITLFGDSAGGKGCW